MMEGFLFIFLITSFIAGFVYSFIILNYLVHWNKIKFAAPPGQKNKTYVSIVIAVRNEEKNIVTCLSHVIGQNYPADLFEIIIINDFSEDRTSQVVSGFISVNSSFKIRLVNLSDFVEEEMGAKKIALHHGIQIAQGKLIVTTDADCTMNERWLSSVVSYYENTKAEFISAPVVLRTKTLFHKLQSLEFMSLIGSGAASIQSGFPLMCNAANLAFEKSMYMAARDESKISSEPSTGDDTFLMFAAWKKNPHSITFIKSHDAIVETNPVNTFSEFISQRKRWASKVKHYSVNHVKSIGVLIFIFHLLLFLSGLLAIVNSVFFPAFITMLVIKAIPDFLFLFSVSTFFNNRRLLWLFIPCVILHVIYMVCISILSFGVSYEWKGRKSSTT